jgi:catalase-peroxidase
MNYFRMLLDYDYELVKSPAGRQAVAAEGPEAGGHGAGRAQPRQARADDDDHGRHGVQGGPGVPQDLEKFRDDPDAFADAFARAWFKLCHRDMGPKARYLGPEVPAEDLIWQDPIPPAIIRRSTTTTSATSRSGSSIGPERFRAGQGRLGFGLDLSRHRPSRRRQRRPDPARAAADWEVNEPEELGRVLKVYEDIKSDFDGNSSGGKGLDRRPVVLGGSAAIEKAAKDAGHDIEVPFTPGRTDASQDWTDVDSFAVLEPKADAFRNYLRTDVDYPVPTEELMIDRASLLRLTVPEMTVLIGGLRVLGANFRGEKHGVLTDRPGQLTNDFFVNLLDMGTAWKPENDHETSSAPTGDGRAEVDRNPGRPGVRLQLAASRGVGGLCVEGRQGEVRARLRRGLDQGDERRPVRPRPQVGGLDREDQRTGRQHGRRGPGGITEGLPALRPLIAGAEA